MKFENKIYAKINWNDKITFHNYSEDPPTKFFTGKIHVHKQVFYLNKEDYDIIILLDDKKQDETCSEVGVLIQDICYNEAIIIDRNKDLCFKDMVNILDRSFRNMERIMERRKNLKGEPKNRIYKTKITKKDILNAKDITEDEFIKIISCSDMHVLSDKEIYEIERYRYKHNLYLEKIDEKTLDMFFNKMEICNNYFSLNNIETDYIPPINNLSRPAIGFKSIDANNKVKLDAILYQL